MSVDIILLKKELRKRLINERSHIDETARKLKDLSILDRLLSLAEYRESELILTYASYNGEVDTCKLIDKALSDGKQVACPRCRIRDDVPLLDFYRITAPEDLIPGYKGIPEPRERQGSKLACEDICGSLVIVPLVGYDRAKNRLGYGKGFYDRFLASCKDIKKIGLAYLCQEEDKLPVDEYDIRLDMIINEMELKL